MCTRRKAFTLLELAAVMAIVAVIASSVLVRSAEWFKSAHIDNVIDQLVFFDQLTRQSAVGHERDIELVFNLDTGSVKRIDLSQKDESRRIRLPRGYRVTKIVTPRLQTTSGIAKIPFTKMGHTPTYAVQISDPSNRRRWYGITGLTGQFVPVDEPSDIDELLSLFKKTSNKLPT